MIIAIHGDTLRHEITQSEDGALRQTSIDVHTTSVLVNLDLHLRLLPGLRDFILKLRVLFRMAGLHA